MNDNHSQDITEVLKETMKSKGIGANKLASLTDVPNRFIDALLKGQLDKLPAKPYIRGYLFKISSVLGIESDELWQAYRTSSETRSSGDQDRLPTNRFALKKTSSKHIVWGLAILAFILFAVFNFNRILGKPTLDINIPETTNQEVLEIEGLANPEDRLTLNGELIYTDDTGLFTKQVQLEPGLNTLEFKIQRYLGKETTIIEQVFYQPDVTEVEPPIENPEDIQTDGSQKENQEN